VVVDEHKRLLAAFYKTLAGTEPVREWLNASFSQVAAWTANRTMGDYRTFRPHFVWTLVPPREDSRLRLI
jgi:hypothetical protein